jgi:hypothetical protein
VFSDIEGFTMQLSVKREDFELLAARAIIPSEAVAALWEGLLELHEGDSLRHKQGASRVSCRRVGLVAGLALVALGLVAGCILAVSVWSRFAGPPLAVLFVALCETLGWLLRTRRIGKDSESEEGAYLWAGVCFCVTALVGLPLLFCTIGIAWGTLAMHSYYQVWGYVVLVMLPSAAHFAISRTRPLASLPLYVHGYVLLVLILVSFFEPNNSIALGAVPPLMLALTYIGMGLFFDYRLRLESFAAYAHATGLMGMVSALGVMLVNARVWPVAVYPFVAVLLLLCGWLVGRRLFFIAGAAIALIWLVATGALIPWVQMSILLAPALLIGVGGSVVAICVLLAKFHIAIERALHNRLPAWVFTDAARRNRANEITTSADELDDV